MIYEDWLYLTDQQYLRILRKIETTVNQPGFKVTCSDCTTPGAKSTDSNCGFCNESYADPDTALFPNQFPDWKSIKYRRRDHKCPFDTRKPPGLLGWGWGCFDGCYLFAHLSKKDWDVSLMCKMVEQVMKATL